jgi:translation initiation factor IF-1
VVPAAAVVVASTAEAAADVATKPKVFQERGLDESSLALFFSSFYPLVVCGAKRFDFADVPKGRMSYEKEQHIEVEGVVAVVLPGTMFRVELANKHIVLATICGKMRKRFVRISTGDRVKMEMSPYDLNKARITWRLK